MLKEGLSVLARFLRILNYNYYYIRGKSSEKSGGLFSRRKIPPSRGNLFFFLRKEDTGYIIAAWKV
jgi:hypothetical protein